MGFRPRNATLLLTLLGLSNILGANGSWLFGAMEEREQDYRRAMQPRQLDSCNSGSKACGRLGCVASRRCCNVDAEWGCASGGACYTANGFVDCYSTTMVMPTTSRKCYDNTAVGCIDEGCFTCDPVSAYCATELISGGGDTWLTCAETNSIVLTITPGIPKPTGTEVLSIRTRTSTGPSKTSSVIPPTKSNTADKLSGGAIAGIAIGALAAIAMAGALIYFFCVRNKRSPGGAAAVVQPQYAQPQQPQMPYQQPPYSPPPQQQPQYMTQQYGPPGYQGQMAHNGYGPDGQPIVPPISSPVYPEHPKQPVTMPAELH